MRDESVGAQLSVRSSSLAGSRVKIKEHGAPPKSQPPTACDLARGIPAPVAKYKFAHVLESLRRDGRFIYGAARPIVRARRSWSHLRSVPRTRAFKATAITTAGATSAAQHKQPLQAVDEASTKIDTTPPRAADKPGHLQQCIARCLQSTCGCLSADASTAAALKSPPPELAPSAAPLPSTRSSDAATLRSLQAELAQLRLDEPDLARAIEVSNETDWLQCFLAASVTAGGINRPCPIVRILSQDFKLEESKVAEILSAGLIEILPEGGEANRAVVAVVRDIQIIGRLLPHSFHDVVVAHLVQLQRLRQRARERGSTGSRWSTICRHSASRSSGACSTRGIYTAQLHGARFLFTAFPVRFPYDCGRRRAASLQRAPECGQGRRARGDSKPLEFVSRPEAVAHCERVFDQPVLRVE